MTWSAVSNNGLTNIYMAETGETMKKRYQSILESHLLPFIDTQCGSHDNCLF